MLNADRAIEQACGALKLNFEIQGSVVPHLRCHLKRRYHGDPALERPIHPDTRRVLLTPEEYHGCMRRIRSALPARAAVQS